MKYEIRPDDLRAPDVAAFVAAHLAFAARHSPPGCVHALDVEALRAEDLTFWTAWDERRLVGCAALRRIDASHGEIKSMRTAPSHRRRGVAAALLEHLLDVARRRGYRRVSLETGAAQAFAPARALYARYGFEPCAPFADEFAGDFSVCMTLELDGAADGDQEA